MQITHLGHSAVLLEVANTRLLFDPGNFSDAWHHLTDLDAVLVTHQHPDHIDPEPLERLLTANPSAQVHVEPTVLDAFALPDGARAIAPDASIELGAVRINAVGGLHAVIHRDIPQIANVGLVVSAEGEPTFFHPGDSLDAVPAGIDVVGVPVMGPWAAMKEHIDFLRALDAALGFPIHDALVSERGWSMMVGRYNEMTPVDLADLRDGRPWTPGS